MAFTTETSNKNIDVLLMDLKLKQGATSVIFENENLFVLSPSVQNKSNRFDINYKNVANARMVKKRSLLIVRHFDELLVGDLQDFLTEMTIESSLYTNKKTKKWSYTVKESTDGYYITLQKAEGLKFMLLNQDRKQLSEYVETLDLNQGNKRSENVISKSDIEKAALVEHIHNYVTSKGFSYSLSNIKNLYLSLRSKPFVIISGISGTGKTKVVQLFAESLGATEENGQFKLIPVRPDWSDGSELLGYLDIKGEFQKGPLTKMVENAKDHSNLPYFVLLDEMNLARVEYYFSDVLSVMESRRRDGNKIISSYLLDGKGIDRPLRLPENLYIIGTVNMDETTHPFSKKVLDRANTIEFNEINLEDFDFLMEQEEVEAQKVTNEQLVANYISMKDIFEAYNPLIKNISGKLAAINNILEPMHLHVGYRVRDEICFYMVHNKNAGLLDENEAFDFCVMQKILPRITGGDGRIDTLLNDLFEWFTGEPYDIQDLVSSSEYPRSAKKVAEMLGRYYTDGFTSFWIS